jgi:isopenicillin-N N-acyltransferase-like protein
MSGTLAPRREPTPPFPFVEIAGDALTRGRQYGQRATERVHRSIEIYKVAFAERGVDWPRAREIAAAFLPRIEQYSPETALEMRGIADGAGASLEDIVAINARTELLYGKHNPGHDAPDDDGCTGAIALPGITANGHLLHGQNWDWRDECADCAVVLHIAPDNGPRALCFVEAGMMARAGMNSEGIALTGNFLECDGDARRQGIPVPVIRRQILMTRGLGYAVQTVLQAPRAFSNNLMVSHAGGEAFDLEATPDEVFWMAPEDGLLVHANHFVTAAARAKVHDTGLIMNGDSLYRDRRVRAYLEAARGRITVDTFKEAFQDRFGSPRAVCRTATMGPGGRVSSTVATLIMDTTDGTMWVAPRPYGPYTFTEYRLDA